MEDKFSLQRFLSAQSEIMDSVMLELGAGKKRGHWMWYIFPQVKGLGRSPTSELYAIQSEDEAIEYLHHPILGQRLVECTKAVNACQILSAEKIFGHPDDLKFRSCMTLFEKLAGKNSPFNEALENFFGGVPDAHTLSVMKRMKQSSAPA